MRRDISSIDTGRSVLTLPLRKPVVLQFEDTLEAAARAMSANNIGSILVKGSDGDLAGVVTDRDLAFALTLRNLDQIDPISMALDGRKLIFVTEDATVDDAIILMEQEGIRRVPIIHRVSQERSRCLGVITFDDLIRENSIHPSDAQAILEIQLEQPIPPSLYRGPFKKALRRQDRRLQTYNRFMSNIANDTGLSRDQARDLTLCALSTILQRISLSEGKDLLSQLPIILRDELMSDFLEFKESYSHFDLLHELSDRFNISADDAGDLLRKFWQALGECVSPGEMEDVATQLPREMRNIFLAGN